MSLNANRHSRRGSPFEPGPQVSWSPSKPPARLDFEQLLKSGAVMDALLDDWFATGGTQQSLVEQLNAAYRGSFCRLGWGGDANWPRLLRRIEDCSACAMSVLIQAVRCGDSELLRHGLARGAHVEQCDGEERDEGPALVAAAAEIGLSMQRVWGKVTPGDVERAVQRREAARTNLRLLVEAGADVNITNKKGETALIKCVEALDLDGVNLLLKAGANVDARDDGGTTALHAALWTRSGDAQVESVCRDRLGIVKALLAAGADPNARSFSRATPLHAYAWSRLEMPPQWAKEIVGALLAAGAQLELRNAEGLTPLLMCVNTGHKSADLAAVEALLDAGADTSATNWAGEGLTKIGDPDVRRPVLALLAKRNIEDAMGGVDAAQDEQRPPSAGGFTL